MSRTTMPTVRLLPTRSWWAALLRTKPVLSIASSTRERVGGETVAGLFNTLDTVPTETCASLATSLIVTRPSGPFDPAGADP